MKIYVSGTFTDQTRLAKRAAELQALGHTITSSWLYETNKPDNLSYDQWMFQLGYKDVGEVFSSDCIVLDQDGNSTSGGRYVEWGVACHPHSMVLRVTVGGKACDQSEMGYVYGCFNHLAHLHYPTWDQLLDQFKDLK